LDLTLTICSRAFRRLRCETKRACFEANAKLRVHLEARFAACTHNNNCNKPSRRAPGCVTGGWRRRQGQKWHRSSGGGRVEVGVADGSSTQADKETFSWIISLARLHCCLATIHSSASVDLFSTFFFYLKRREAFSSRRKYTHTEIITKNPV